MENTIEGEPEAPVLRFNDYKLAFHFAVPWNEERASPTPESEVCEPTDADSAPEPMESYERDLLLHAHRDTRPFWTRVRSVPAFSETVSVRFPAELVVASEERRFRLECADGKAGRRRTFRVLTSETTFGRSRIDVLNVVFRPLSSRAAESELNEYDVIKLIKLWEGGEGRSIAKWEKEILFETQQGDPKTLEELVRQLFPDRLALPDGTNEQAQRRRARWRPTRRGCVKPVPLAYRVGTVELEILDEEPEQLFGDIAQLGESEPDIEAEPEPEGPPDPESEHDRWNRVVAVGGVLQGLLDFREIDRDELADVFAEVDLDPDELSFVGFHKGTLLSLSAEAEAEGPPRRPSPIGVDPYLALPNAVLLHNEQRLKAARQLELHLSEGQPRRADGRSDIYSSRRSRPSAPRLDIDQTANELDEMTGLLAQHLPNVFHYKSERLLYETGERSRGFDDLKTLVGRGQEELTSTLHRRERRRDRWTAGVAIVSAVVVSVVAAVNNWFAETAVETVDWWLLLAVAGLLWLTFRRARNRFF